MGMKRGSITLNRRPKDSQWSGIIQLLLGGRSLWLPLHQGKSWPLFFCDAEGEILVDIMPRGQTINSDLYIQTLKNLQKRLRRVRPHKNVAEILLQHDNARSHTSVKTQEAITKLGWTVLPHQPYRPDIAPSDFHLFGALKDAISGKRFGSDYEVTEKVKKWLRVQDSDWHKMGIHAVVSRWHKAVEVDGDYAEKWRV
jgi:histone-lysine N-methyltransferase SETMAR